MVRNEAFAAAPSARPMFGGIETAAGFWRAIGELTNVSNR
jgi:hypothetical protein